MFNYRVKVVKKSVKSKTYLWGSESAGVALEDNLYLTFRIDEFGEALQITREWLDGDTRKDKMLGEFQAGETFTVPLRDSTGFFAACVDEAHDSFVDCSVSGLAQ
jgi:hypothetical protein